MFVEKLIDTTFALR